MHAAVITGKGRLEIIDVPEPVPEPGGVVVDIEYCGVCGTDIHAFQSDNPYNPAICGHEWTGVLSAVASDVRSVTEGDRVVVSVPPACGRCSACSAGQTKWCTTVFLAATGRDLGAPRHGGFAPQLAIPSGRVLKANPALSSLQAAQIEPATVAFHAVSRSGLRLGDVAVIQGAGPIGLTTMQWVKARGAGVIIAIEPNDQRRQLALDLGATHALTPAEAGPAILEATRGLGADIVYECVGRAFAIQAAANLVRRGGEMCMVGVSDTNAEIVPVSWLIKELTVTSSLAYTHDDFDKTMGMVVDGRVLLEPMHSLTVGLDGLGDALADLGSGTSIQTKVLVDPRI